MFLQNEVEVFRRRYTKDFRNQQMHPEYTIGTHVRVLLPKMNAFDKSYTQNYSTEIYEIAGIREKAPRLMFVLRDLAGVRLSHLYYSNELVSITD